MLLLLILQLFGMKAQQQFFEKFQFSWDTNAMPYRLMLPKGYNDKDSTKYPIILFLHGAGERGNDNILQLTYIDTLFGSEKFRNQYPCFVLAPQCPLDMQWVNVDWHSTSHTIPSQMSIPMKMAVALLIQTIHKYNIDTNCIYVVGLSMGGYGTWDILARFPKMFAAAVPICGGADLNTACKIKNIPVWVYHGEKDKVVYVSRSRGMVDALKKCGGHPIYTEVQSVGHLVWTKAFGNKDLWKWLFEQKK